MGNLATINALVVQKIKQDNGKTIVTSAQIDTNIQEAAKRYSDKRPYDNLSVLTGNDTGIFTLPSDYEDGFSRIINVEYPLSSFPPAILEKKTYIIERTTDGVMLRFYCSPYPTTGETGWLRYTIRHTITVAAITVPTSDWDAIANLAASISLENIAAYWNHTADSTLSADVVAYRSKGDEAASRARDYFKMYDSKITQRKNGIIGEWDLRGYENEELLLKRPEDF